MASDDDIALIKLVLRRHMAIFERCSDCTPLVGLLRANNMMDEYKYQHITGIPKTSIERNRECLDAIIQAVDVLPDYFDKFCSILNIMPCYKSVVKSLVTCHVVYRSEEHIKKYINIDKLLMYFKGSLTLNELSTKTAGADNCSNSREECFIKMLQRKDPKFIEELMKYLALKDCLNHSTLFLHLQNLKDDFQKSLCTPSVVSYLPGIKRYQDFLKRFYIDMIKIEAQNVIKTSIHQYVNLSLITPQNQDKQNDYFKAIRDPRHLLFNHKEYTTTTPLKSLAEIFDTLQLTPQIILMQGSPGSGKTTLATEICIQWAKGNLIQHYILVILLKLRDPRISDIDCFDEVVSCTLGDSNFATEVVSEINCIDGKSILLLLEGWDEFPEDKQHKSFFTKLISGKALKNCDVLITSRPSSIGSIQKSFITRHIAILGFSDDQIEQYLDHCFADSSNELKGGLKHRFLCQLNCNSTLKSLAYVPVNLSILVHVFTQYGAKLPSTLTELYHQYVLLKLSLYNQRISNNGVRFTKIDCLPVYISESLNKLGELAYCGLKNQKLYFAQTEMEKLYQSVPLDYDGMGLLQVENHMLNRGSYKTYNFIHRTVQEFLAAWHMTKIPKKKSIILENLQLEHFEMVLVFFAGLTGFKFIDFAALLHLIKDGNISTSDKANLFIFNILSKGHLKYFYKLGKIETYSQNISQHRLLVLIACCAESKNPAVCKALSNSCLFHKDACHVDLYDSAVTSHLLSSLSYCIAHSGKNWIVKCDKVLNEQDIVNLQKCLIDSNETSGKLEYINTLTDRKTVHFFVTFLQPHFMLFALDLGESVLDDDCVTVLSEGLKTNCNLIILLLKKCDISKQGILIIAEMLQVNNTLQLIDLEDNIFSSDDLIKVLQIMKSNTTLRILNVDTESLQEQVKKQLALFNKKRKYQLFLNLFHSMRLFGWMIAKDDYSQNS